ncbi:MAG: hypothetical protein US37_C0001G0154 [Candidatus Moranbacteria bacterium GW2011_GWF2_37_11]|nr:MAG: hypothetical protein US37_C0001G0154 [Candidatus Moranbacteria bacterium GW2011_GWF2_37_11]
MKKKISQKKKNIIGKNDQFGVILEDINSKFDLIMESFDGMNRKIDKNHEEFLEFKEDMTGFKNNMTEFKSDMTGFRKDMVEFKSDMTGFKKESESKFDTILSYLMSIDEELKEIKMELEIFKKSEKYQNEEIRLLEIRIKKLEKDNVKLHKLLIKAS